MESADHEGPARGGNPAAILLRWLWQAGNFGHPLGILLAIAILFASAGAGVAYHYVFGSYVASTVVAPPPESSSSSLSRLGGLQGVLANSGLPLTGSSGLNPDFEHFIFFLNSIEMAQVVLDRRPDFVVHFFPGDWDHDSGSWKKDSAGDSLKPSPGALSRYLGRNLLPSHLPNTSFVRVSFFDRDPDFAQKFLAAYLRLADDVVRQRNEATYKSQQKFLQGRLSDNTLKTDVRDALSSLMIDVLRNLMMVDSQISFAYQSVDPPYSDSTASPSPGLITCILAGLFAGFTLLIGIYWLRWRFLPPPY